MRIKSIEGLRAFAALGVLWIHVWLSMGSPALIAPIGGWALPLDQLLSIVGSGVNFFYVISGFCMYYVTLGDFGGGRYIAFIKRRWLRIAPAFYAASVACFAGLYVFRHELNLKPLLSHFLFLHTTVPNMNSLAPPLWSIGVEVQFYLLLPVYCALLRTRWAYLAGAGLFLLQAVIRSQLSYLSPEGRVESDWQYTFAFHFVEFWWGICAAKYFRDGGDPGRYAGRFRFFLCVFILYAGRFLKSSEAADWFGPWAVAAWSLAEPVMTFGFAGLLLNVVCGSASPVKAILESRPAAHLGRISYSFYLWHWWPTVLMTGLAAKHFGTGFFPTAVTFIAIAAVITAVANVSYVCFEKFYFRRGAAN